MKLLLFAIPLLLFIATILIIGYVIFSFAKANKNPNGMSTKKKLILNMLGLSPILLFGLFFMLISSSNNKAQEEFQEGVESGDIILYEVDDTINVSDTQKIVLKDNSGMEYGSFDIFTDNLYVSEEGTRIHIQTREFDDVKHISKNAVGFLGFLRQGAYSHDAEGYEKFLRGEGHTYEKKQTPSGTIYTWEEVEKARGRFMFKLFFEDSDYSVVVGVSYRSKEDRQTKYSPVISREYAKQLYSLVISTLEISRVDKLHSVYNLQAN